MHKMGTIHKDSIVKNVLKNLCCCYGWSYGVFWSYDQPNSLLLTQKDAYFDEEFRDLIDDRLLQVPIGGGIIGQAAYTNKHLWISSEDHYNEHNFSGSISDMFLDDRGFGGQFSAGIKTIAIIPVEPQGVVQFGAKEKILERMEFVNQTKRMFQEIVNGGLEIASSSLNSQICHQNGFILPEESRFFDTPLDFGFPNEFFQTEDFNLEDFTPADDFFSFLPVNLDESVTISGNDIDLLENKGDLGDILAPFIDGNHSGFGSYGSECMFVPKPTPQFDRFALAPKERLFSKLGIEELFEGISGISTSCVEGQVAKRRKTGNSMWDESLLRPVVYNNNVEIEKEVMAKSVSGLRVVDGYSVSGSSTAVQAKKQVEPSKPVKKKAKPGTRPRPKDRQQILDRMAELRQLIPNGEKMSIDSLLDRTIKHMLFLQSVTKQADRLREADEPKNNGVVSIDPSTNGVTWACELGNQTVVCPLIVEDLGTPGQMLIEMLYEEQGLFLEIVDIIRSFGLIILKGVMEARTDKIWARFIVEPEINKHVTRHGLFSTLVRFLQTTDPDDEQKCGRIGSSLLDDLNRQYGIQNVVNLAEMQYCMNL